MEDLVRKLCLVVVGSRCPEHVELFCFTVKIWSRGQAFGTAVKLPLGHLYLASKYLGSSPAPLPSSSFLLIQRLGGDGKSTWVLPPPRETWVDFWAPSFGLAQPPPLRAFKG